jgi:hypothetical protein
MSISRPCQVSSNDRNDRPPISVFTQLTDLPQADPVVDLVRKEYSTGQTGFTGSLSRLDLAKNWLTCCIDRHDRCRAWQNHQSSKGMLPSRVIDVVGREDESQDPFLYESLNQPGLYVALSHRWGGSKILTTTTSTLEDRKRRIPLASMPKTFQDAIAIVRHFGFRYLWIDSLCIIQDNLQDWEAEAKTMGTVYSNAALTIMAVAATSADSGCFTQLKVDLGAADSGDVIDNLPCELGTLHIDVACPKHPAGHDFSIFAHHPILTSHEKRSGFRSPGPLDTRGWVLQEELLSLRRLMFSDDGLFWECLDADASDSNPIGRAPPDNFEASIETRGHGISKENSYARDFKLLLLNGSSQQAANPHGSEQRLQPLELKRHLYDSWISMVTNFTSRELSNESDRLIAMEGTATALSALLDDECVAGLWRRDFSRQLLWRVDDVEIRIRSPCGCDPRSMIALWGRPRRAEQRPGLFPSWSWANINQAVTYAE